MFRGFYQVFFVRFRMAGLVGVLWLLSGTSLAQNGDIGHRVVASSCAKAANQWIASLNDEQSKLAVWPFDEEKRRDWHYLNNLPPIYMRKEGLAFKAMESEQRILGHKLIRCGLSSQGYQKVTGIMILESIGWGRLPDKGIEAAKRMSDTVGTMDAYWLAVFGDPMSGQPWQMQLEGHHVALNFTFVDGEVAVTPTFLGTRPNVILDGEYAGWHAMGYEKDRAFELLVSLSPDQLSKAVVADEVANNIFIDPARLDTFDSYTGIPARALDSHQRNLLWRVINEYVMNYEYEVSDDRISEIKKDGIESVYFAWMGDTDDSEKPIYFRIHGPSVLIEFVNASNLGGRSAPKLNPDGSLKRGKHDLADPNHIHSVYLNPRRNFGKDLLRAHYETAAHHQDD